MNLIEQAASLVVAVVDHALDGHRRATPDVQADRQRSCRACPLLDHTDDRCTSCGCFMAIKWAWASSACPLDPPRWEAT